MEPDPSIGRAPQLGDYAAVLKARKWLVISITLLALVGAGTYLAVRTPVYSSHAEIQVFPAEDGLGTSIDLETEARIAASLSVAQLALQKLGDAFASAEGLQEHVSVTLPSDAAILTITFTDTDRGVAVDGAKAVADSYQEFKANQASQQIDSQRISLERQYQEFQDQETILRARIAETTDPAEKFAATTELGIVRAQLEDVRGRLLALENDQPQASQLISPPSRAKLASPGLPLVLIGAGVLGLFLGSILAFIIEGLTGRVREAEEVEEELGSAVLGMVPIMHLKRTRGRVPVVSRDSPSEPAAEAYRLLRSGFLYAAGSDERIVMVTSPGVGDGKSTTAANLAVALAQAGHRTVLVGGDLRRSDLHTLFGVPNDTGLVHVLEGRSRPAPLPTDVENLRIVPSGPPTEISAHLFETEAFPEALAILREQAEYVVVDAPPLAISDPLLMVPAVDYVLFVVDAGKATRRALRRTRELLQRIGLPRMGVVLNRSKSPWGPSGTRAYYYYKKGKAAGVPAVAPEAAAREPIAVAAASPVESKPVESKPMAAEKPAGPKPVEPVAAEKPAESKPVESKPVTTQTPIESKPIESKPVEPIAAESKPADSKAAAGQKPVESQSAAAEKPAESKPVESKPVAPESKPVESEPAAAEKPKPEITPDAKSIPATAKTEPAATVTASDTARAKSSVPSSPTSPATRAPAPGAPPAQQAPGESVTSEPAAATSAQAPAAPSEAAEATHAGSEATPPAPPVPVESPPPVPPVPAAGTPITPAAGTPPVPDTPAAPEPSGQPASEPAIEAIPQPVVEPSSRNGGRASKRSGSRKRRSGNRGRSRPSGG